MPSQSCQRGGGSRCRQGVQDGEGWLESGYQNGAIEVTAAMLVRESSRVKRTQP